MPQHQALLALGANLGESSKALHEALDLLAKDQSISSIVSSTVLSTAPVGGPDQPVYANAAAVIHTSYSPNDLIACLRQVEQVMGRKRDSEWGARTLDLDLIGFDSLIINNAQLTIPHPRMTVRRFVIDPLVEIAAEWIHPQLGWPVAQIRNHLENASRIVSLGACSAEILSHSKLASAIHQFEQLNPGWKFIEHADNALFDLAYMRDFECDQRWRFPRFYPTQDLPEILLEQCFATCRGLADLP